MNDVVPTQLDLANRQMDNLIRGIMLLRADLKSQAKPSKIGMMLRLEALEKDARAVETTLEIVTRDARIDDFRSKAVAK